MSDERKPCRPYPEDASFKTIGLAECPRCGCRSCWDEYLRWEKRVGVALNASEHHTVDGEWKP